MSRLLLRPERLAEMASRQGTLRQGKRQKNGSGENPQDSQGSTQRRKNAVMLYLAVFITGSCGLAYEYTVSKVASDLMGNSTRQWAMIIGVMMFFMGLGANQQKVLRQQSLLAWFALLEILLSLLGGLAPLLLLWAYAYWQSYYILWQYLLIAAIGFLIGLEIPIITRINENFTPELKVNIGRTLQMDYVGALGGAILWSYWLIPYLPLSRAAAILGFANLAVTWLFIGYFYRQLRWRKALLLFSSVATGLLLLIFWQGPKWSWQTEQGLYRDPIIFSKTTPYQHFVFTRSARRRKPYWVSGDPLSAGEAGLGQPEYRLYINGHIQFSSRDEFIYHENLVHPAFALFHQRTGMNPARVLILGGGDGLALREVRKYASVQEVILCDLDPEILRFAKENPVMRKLNQDALHATNVTALETAKDLAKGQVQHTRSRSVLAARKWQAGSGEPHKDSGELLQDVRVVLKSLDAARYLEQAPGRFDIIIADFPDPNNENLSKLYSLPFYHNILRKLTSGGVFIQQSTSPVYAFKAFWAIGRTMMAAGLEALPYHDLVPSFGEWGWWLAVAGPGQRSGNSATFGETSIAEQLQASRLQLADLRYLRDDIMQANLVFNTAFQEMYRNSLAVFFPARYSKENAALPTDSTVDTGSLYRDWVTTFTQPRVYQYYLESSWQ